MCPVLLPYTFGTTHVWRHILFILRKRLSKGCSLMKRLNLHKTFLRHLKPISVLQLSMKVTLEMARKHSLHWTTQILLSIAAQKCPASPHLLEDAPCREPKRLALCWFVLFCSYRPRPILLHEWTKRVFDIFHKLSHPGHLPTLRAISNISCGSNENRYCKAGVKHITFVKYRHERPVRHAATTPTPERRFGSLHVGIVGRSSWTRIWSTCSLSLIAWPDGRKQFRSRWKMKSGLL